MVTGFGILIPLGVLVARTMKMFDPLWFHLHRAIQVRLLHTAQSKGANSFSGMNSTKKVGTLAALLLTAFDRLWSRLHNVIQVRLLHPANNFCQRYHVNRLFSKHVRKHVTYLVTEQFFNSTLDILCDAVPK